MTRPSVSLDVDRELEELRQYLGEGYDHSRLERYQEEVLDEFRAVGDESAFYRTSEAYLYDLTAFAASQTKVPYLNALARVIPPRASVLDYGCGIGSDGMLLMESGFDVAFADFDNPSTRYLKWRLSKRGLQASIYDLDHERPTSGFDAAFAFDVIEHVDDPFAFLDRLADLASVVAVNFLEDEDPSIPLHRVLPVRRLLAHAAKGRILYYGVHHGRSHLVIYSASPSGPLDRARSRARLALGTLRRRLGRLQR